MQHIIFEHFTTRTYQWVSTSEAFYDRGITLEFFFSSEPPRRPDRASVEG